MYILTPYYHPFSCTSWAHTTIHPFLFPSCPHPVPIYYPFYVCAYNNLFTILTIFLLLLQENLEVTKKKTRSHKKLKRKKKNFQLKNQQFFLYLKSILLCKLIVVLFTQVTVTWSMCYTHMYYIYMYVHVHRAPTYSTCTYFFSLFLCLCLCLCLCP